MHKKFFIVTAIVLAVAAGLASAVAQITHSGRHGRHSDWMLQRMAAKLNLTDAQQAQIKNILQAEKAKTEPLRQQLRQNRMAQTGNTTGAFDEAQVRAFADKQARLKSDLMVERERAKSQMFAVLTPDQRQKAITLMQERRQRRPHHMHKNFRPGASATPGQ
jgi:Spy/CpxP family protein refolding chaperone